MKTRLIIPGLLILVIGYSGCKTSPDLSVSNNPEMMKLAPPITLQTDSTCIVLADYFKNPLRVDSVLIDPSITFSFSNDSLMLILKPTKKEVPSLSLLTCWIEGYSYSLMIKRSPAVWIRVTFDPLNKTYKQVQLAGQMNDWNPARANFRMHDSIWETRLLLFPGNYQYKLVIDGTWISDPANPDSAGNGIGGYNSILRAGNLTSSDLPFLYSQKSVMNTISIGGTEKTDTAFVFWQNYRLPPSFIHHDSSGMTIRIPDNSVSCARSYIRVWGSNKTGLSNDLLIPLKYGKVITNPKELNRADKETLILYFMMVDRFRNGDPASDHPVNDPEVDPKVNYMGGDLQGIIDKIDDGYFSDLGVNALWISPVTQNPVTAFREYPEPHRKFSGYHGYWPVTFTSIDTRFGSSKEMKKLVKEAHSHDMNVILDFVAHHVHQDYPLLRDHPGWITQLDLPDGRKNIRLWDEYRLSTWFDSFLPTLDLSKPEVYELVSDSAAWWITEYQLDGFRHDAAKHVPGIFWRTLTKKLDSILEPENRSIYQIGETFGSRELIGSYINPGMLDAQFDFNLYWEVRNAFASGNSSFRDLNIALMQSLTFFGYHNLMGNITGNQDMARFISYASGSLKMNEDDREAGWKRNIQVNDTIGYRRLASLMAFNMTIPGIPVIYYGDEFGMPGANDPDNRRMMKFDSLSSHEQWMLAMTRKLTSIRNHTFPLLYGEYHPLIVTDKLLIFLRVYMNQIAVVAFNKDRNAKKIEIQLPDWADGSDLSVNFGSTYEPGKHKILLSLSGNSFEILTNQVNP